MKPKVTPLRKAQVLECISIRTVMKKPSITVGLSIILKSRKLVVLSVNGLSDEDAKEVEDAVNAALKKGRT